MSNSNNEQFKEEEAGRTRNNENGEVWPTPKQDVDRGTDQNWLEVGQIVDETDKRDGKRAWW